MSFQQVLRMVIDSYENVFWTSRDDAREHADTLLKCATEIYIAQQGKYIIKREEK